MSAFFVYLFKLSICFGLLYFCFKLFLANDTFFRFNRYVILFGALICFILPFLKITLAKTSILQAPFAALEELIFPYDYPEIENLLVKNETALIPDTEPVFSPWIIGLLCIYLAGIIINIFFLAKSILSMYKLINSGKKEKYGMYSLTVIGQDISPFSWRNNIVISAEDYKYNSDEILAHEIAHIKSKHSYDLIFFELVGLVQWFNPAVWLLKRELKNIHEFQADTTALQSGIDATKYQLLLVKKAVGYSSYTLTNSFNHSKIKKRITMMLKEKSNKNGRLKLLLFLPAATLAMFTFARSEILKTEEETNSHESTNIFSEPKNYSFPLKNVRKTPAPFGMRTHPASGKQFHHNGIDMVGLGKDTIYAFYDGVILMAERQDGYGNVILISHEGGLESLYAHNSKNLVQAGDQVYSGMPIGITGNTGLSTGEHLHFEIRENGTPVNPEQFFEQK